MTGRLLHQPATLGGHELAAGQVVLAAIYMAHTDAATYPDPFAFRPERFLGEGPETTRRLNSGASPLRPSGSAIAYPWVPFGGGTRRCIGAAFAQMELGVALRTIFESVRLEPADPRPERMVRRNATLSPANGTRVLVS